MLLAQQDPSQFTDLPADITGPIEVAGGNPMLVLAMVMMAALALGGGLFYVYWKRRALRPAKSGTLSAREEARRRLAQWQKAYATMDPADLAGELSSIVRRFFHRQYGVDLESQTTDEFWAAMQELTRQLPPQVVEPLAEFFAQCDAFRFQGGELTPAMVEPLFHQAQSLIETSPAMAAA